LAAQDKNFLNKNLSEINLSFYYLQTPEKITLKKTDEDLDETKNNIINMIGDIRQNIFPANPGMHCDFCPFKIICEAWQ